MSPMKRNTPLLLFAFLVSGGSFFLLRASMKDHDSAPIPSIGPGEQVATLAGGCFWCLDSVFRTMDGVKAVTTGYTGGNDSNPTYEQVCDGDTGHAEVVQIVFDPTKISYAKLLDIFWTIHDPTSLNRQGNDVGTQYRSAVFYHNDEQRMIAEKSKAEVQGQYRSPIVTEIVPLKKFWPAEIYHQDYFRKNPSNAYCRFTIPPKISKVQHKFSEQLAK